MQTLLRCVSLTRSKATDQVQLTAREHGDPEQMEDGVEQHPREPRVAGGGGPRGPQRARPRPRPRARRRVVLQRAPHKPAAAHQQARQEADEVLVVLLTWN